MAKFMTFSDTTLRRSNLSEFWRAVKQHWELLAMLAIPIAWFITYSYVPIYGITLAFKRYMVLQGIVGSPWVGLEHFERLLGSSKFYQVLGNTFVLAFLRLIFFMPCPIIFALLLNEVRVLRFKKSMQTVTYLPYFLSWVVVAGIVRNLLSPVNGLFNYFIVALGDKPVNFLLQPLVLQRRSSSSLPYGEKVAGAASSSWPRSPTSIQTFTLPAK